MLSIASLIVKRSVIMSSVVMQNVVMLSVTPPKLCPKIFQIGELETMIVENVHLLG
jgi:hypothetical protein